MFGKKKSQTKKLVQTISATLGNPSWLNEVLIRDGNNAVIVINSDSPYPKVNEDRRLRSESLVRGIKGVHSVTAILTSHQSEHQQTKDPPIEIKTHSNSSVKKVDGISRIVVVASAKGGVGKSTVAVNLAVTLAQGGFKVGLLDTDIYGPSIPTMLGTTKSKLKKNKNGRMQPVEAHGIKTLSMGYVADPESAVVWRGPMVSSAISQLVYEGDWTDSDNEPLDFLIVDTPPGTGDAQLTLIQKIPVTACILVTTPQKVAITDTQRSAAMFTRVNMPLLGIIETMSWYETVGKKIYLMGKNGGYNLAKSIDIPCLGQIPISDSIREGGDKGKPAVLSDQSVYGQFNAIATNVCRELDKLTTRSSDERQSANR